MRTPLRFGKLERGKTAFKAKYGKEIANEDK